MTPITWKPTDLYPRALEEVALREHAAAVGKLFLVTWITGYRDGDQIEEYLEKPLLVRVENTNEDSILHWNDEFLDPYWDVEVLSPLPETLKGGQSWWIDGPSHNRITGESEHAGKYGLSSHVKPYLPSLLDRLKLAIGITPAVRS